MRSVRFSLLLNIVVFFSIKVSAQVPNLSPLPPLDKSVRDVEAVGIVEKTIAVMGGAALVGQVQSSIVQGDMTGASDTSMKSGSFVWKASGKEFRFEGSSASGMDIFVTGRGKPGQTGNGTTKKIEVHKAMAMFVPALIGSVLFQELQEPKYSIRYSGSGAIAGTPVVIVTTAVETRYPDNVVTPQVWYIDNSTGLPVRVEFRSPGVRRPANFTPVALDFSDYRAISGTLYPLHLVYSMNGKILQTFSINSIQVNVDISSSDFDGPTGGIL